MQRKPTRQTRGPNADEKRFHAYTKESDCIGCGNPGPSIVHHCEGSCHKHNKVLIGHWFVIPLCLSCDDVITHGSKPAFREQFGPQSELWLKHADSYSLSPPEDVVQAIWGWNK